MRVSVQSEPLTRLAAGQQRHGLSDNRAAKLLTVFGVIIELGRQADEDPEVSLRFGAVACLAPDPPGARDRIQPALNDLMRGVPYEAPERGLLVGSIKSLFKDDVGKHVARDSRIT
jgi:hypothetical protein